MNTQAPTGYGALTEKEKQTLRLIVRGHDAKSIARSLGLSVHTINERLRDARRKMAVSSSREAARLLLDTEGEAGGAFAPHSLGDVKIGEAGVHTAVTSGEAPANGAGRTHIARITIGVVLMTLALGFIMLTALPQLAATSEQNQITATEAADTQIVDTARQWLALVDQGRWDDSYRATGAAFRSLNTSQVWASTSEKVRTPLGAVKSRTLIAQTDVPAPPAGYQVVKFRTDFANKANAVETVSLAREDGAWRVVGVTIG